MTSELKREWYLHTTYLAKLIPLMDQISPCPNDEKSDILSSTGR
jgi:hypothetical protein